MEDSRNQALLIKSQTSLNNEYKTAIDKFGAEYSLFLQKYPTLGKRNEMITSEYDAVSQGGMTISNIDKHFRKGASEWWIKVMLIDMLTFLGAMESITTYQVKGIASRIRNEYYHLTPSELTYFFYSFSIGKYGKMYVGRTVNPQDILIGLQKYMEELTDARIEYDNKKNQKKFEEEMKRSRENAIDFEEYKKLKGLPEDYKIPFERIKELSEKINIKDKDN